MFIAWPSGGTYLEQDQYMLSVFSICKDEYFRWAKEQRRKNG